MQLRRVAWVGVVWMACGGGDEAAKPPDAAAEVLADAASPDAAAAAFCPEPAPEAGNGFESCNPVTQGGCAADEKCSWLVVQLDPFLGRTDCVPDGTVAIGESCSEGDPGEATGYDDCAAGGLCMSGTCRAICDLTSDSCCEGFACSSYTATFTDDSQEDTGVCDATCDPVAQDCADAARGCYLQLFTGHATCSLAAPGAEELTQGDTCANDGASCFLNGCAKGYGAFLYAGDGLRRDCTAFCRPVETYLVDPDGDGEGALVGGADPDGGAPHDCAEATIGVPAHQCRFFQSYFVDMNSQPLDYVSDAYGFCTPTTDIFGDCTRYSEEWFLEQYNQFIDGGGTREEWGTQLTTLCADRPGGCAPGCVKVATRDALDAAYCAVPANATRPACMDLVRP
jgi:hypothetical protein